jgi:carbon starvation protein
MNSAFLLILAGVGFLVAYHTYGRFLARRIFRIQPENTCPSRALQDNYDYVPTSRHVLFGHHFTSIAGLGPIVGPAIAVIWGWLPAVIWILFGAVFFGAVHDFGALVVSLRKSGRSIGDIVADLVGPRVRLLFLLIIFFELWLLIAVFALIIAMLFVLYPQSVVPVWIEIVVAVALGWWVYRKKGGILWPSIIAVATLYLFVWVGTWLPVDFVDMGASHDQAIMLWMGIVALYALAASLLPVQTLLQPRDYINSHQLMIAGGLLFAGVLWVQPAVVAPAVENAPAGAPAIFPFIFVVIACGAISGFHCLVSSGTSSKQCESEQDAQFISYGSMLMEGGLSILVIIACTAGLGLGLDINGQTLTGESAFHAHYASWQAAQGLGSKLDAFIQGSANILSGLGIPPGFCLAVMAVFIVSFAATTVDTATRIQRYIVVELGKAAGIRPLTYNSVATIFAVATALLLAFYDGTGKGALRLWPLWGTVNQLLAGLSLLAVTLYLAEKKIRFRYTFLPMVFMLVITCWALVLNIHSYYTAKDWLLMAIGSLIMGLNIWLLLEGLGALQGFVSNNKAEQTASGPVPSQHNYR